MRKGTTQEKKLARSEIRTLRRAYLENYAQKLLEGDRLKTPEKMEGGRVHGKGKNT